MLKEINKKVEKIEEKLKQEEDEEEKPEEEEEKKKDENEEEEKQDDIKSDLAEIKSMLSELATTLKPVEESKQEGGEAGVKPVNPNPEGGEVTLPESPTGEGEDEKPESDEVNIMEKTEELIDKKLEDLKKSLNLKKVSTSRPKIINKSQYDNPEEEEEQIDALKIARGEQKMNVEDQRIMNLQKQDKALESIFGK